MIYNLTYIRGRGFRLGTEMYTLTIRLKLFQVQKRTFQERTLFTHGTQTNTLGFKVKFF